MIIAYKALQSNHLHLGKYYFIKVILFHFQCQFFFLQEPELNKSKIHQKDHYIGILYACSILITFPVPNASQGKKIWKKFEPAGFTQCDFSPEENTIFSCKEHILFP